MIGVIKVGFEVENSGDGIRCLRFGVSGISVFIKLGKRHSSQ